jgi:hypothetical protein
MTTDVTPKEGNRLSFGLITLWTVFGVGFVIATLFGGPILLVPALLIAGPLAVAAWIASHQRGLSRPP